MPGTGGRIKACADDFRVEELPLYPAAGEGEHLFLRVEKRGRTTQQVSRELATTMGVSTRAVGHAGLKDAQAVTRQWLSIQTILDPDPASLQGRGWRTLELTRHRNKLRPGHLRGNRFSVVIRGVTNPVATAAMMEHLRNQGFPNYYGEQRFGVRGDNVDQGRALLGSNAGTRVGGRERRRFLIQSVQATLFNSILARRLDNDTDLSRLYLGDLAYLHCSGASFRVDEKAFDEARRRSGAGEISGSAPLFGYRVDLAEGIPGHWETECLEGAGLTLDDFRRRTKASSLRGTRRPVRVFPRELEWHLEDQAESLIRASFILGPGVYATSMLRELIK